MAKKTSGKKKTWVLQAQLISILRRLFVKSPMFQAVRKAARREKTVLNKDGSVSKAHRTEYQCAICGDWFSDCKTVIETTDKKGKVSKKKVHSIAVDHVEPFVPTTGMPRLPDGSIDWSPLIKRMFLDVEVWDPEKSSAECLKGKARLLCWACHNATTQVQAKERRDNRKKK